MQGDRLYTQEQRGDDEIVACYKVSTGEPVWRRRRAGGTKSLPELMAAGVNVAFGHDCVMDPWYGMGSGDMLEVAHMGLHVALMTSQAGIRACFDAVTTNAATFGQDPTWTADGRAVIFRDARLECRTNGTGSVAEHDLGLGAGGQHEGSGKSPGRLGSRADSFGRARAGTDDDRSVAFRRPHTGGEVVLGAGGGGEADRNGPILRLFLHSADDASRRAGGFRVYRFRINRSRFVALEVHCD